MTGNRELYFQKVYVIFVVIAGALLVGQAGYIITHADTWEIAWPVLGFMLCMALAAGFFALFIKKGIQSVFQELDYLINNAIDKEELSIAVEETELSKFGEKVKRFMEIQKDKSSQSREQRRQVESLISDISHQTKTPVANIMIFSELLETLEITDTMRDYVEKITDQTEKLKWMIETMVNLSRMETGMIRCRPEANFVQNMLLEALGQHYQKAEKKNIDITLSCDPTCRAVFDSRWTCEALCNLIDNGIKYTKEGGRLAIEVMEYEMYVRIDVADTGAGIPKEEWNDIFKRFYRGQNVRHEDGVGIGLYLVRKIVQEQHGYISVSSKPGKGSRFSVFIPRTT